MQLTIQHATEIKGTGSEFQQRALLVIRISSGESRSLKNGAGPHVTDYTADFTKGGKRVEDSSGIK